MIEHEEEQTQREVAGEEVKILSDEEFAEGMAKVFSSAKNNDAIPMSNMEPADAKAILSKLKAEGENGGLLRRVEALKFNLSNSGDIIFLVPIDKITYLELAKKKIYGHPRYIYIEDNKSFIWPEPLLNIENHDRTK